MSFKLYHAALTVLDLDKSVNFYKEALGLNEVKRIVIREAGHG